MTDRYDILSNLFQEAIAVPPDMRGIYFQKVDLMISNMLALFEMNPSIDQVKDWVDNHRILFGHSGDNFRDYGALAPIAALMEIIRLKGLHPLNIYLPRESKPFADFVAQYKNVLLPKSE